MFKNNINCFPIPVSRKDIIIAKKRPITKGVNYGYVGNIKGVDKIHLQKYFETHDLILMPSIVLDKESSEILNVNADTLATEVAIALNANKLIFISDVEYILDKKGNYVRIDKNISYGLISLESVQKEFILFNFIPKFLLINSLNNFFSLILILILNFQQFLNHYGIFFYFL